MNNQALHQGAFIEAPEHPARAYMQVSLGVLPPNSELKSPGPSQSLIDSVKRHGVLDSITIVLMEDSSYTVIAGSRRIMALRQAHNDWDNDRVTHGMSQYPQPAIMMGAYVYPSLATYLQHELVIASNETRASNVAAGVDAIEALLREGYSAESIRARTGISPQVYRQRVQLLNLIDRLRTMLRENTISANFAFASSKLDPLAQGELANQIEQSGTATMQMVRNIQALVTLPRETQSLFDLEEVKIVTPPPSATVEGLLREAAGLIDGKASLFMLGVRTQLHSLIKRLAIAERDGVKGPERLGTGSFSDGLARMLEPDLGPARWASGELTFSEAVALEEEERAK